MSENILLDSKEAVSFRERPRAFDTIIYGGLVVGVLDGLAAVVNAGLRGTSPTHVFQYIAGGLLGRESFSGGLITALLGILLHFFIAFMVAAVYYGASLRFPVLIRQAVIWGMIYGVMVYFVMSYVVMPLSATPKFPFSLAALLTGVIIHIFFVGLPIALIAQRSAKAI